MREPHKHAEIIKAWADGKTIQCSMFGSEWKDIANPSWNLTEETRYRVKPETFWLGVHEVPMPLTERPEEHSIVFAVNPVSEAKYTAITFYKSSYYCQELLKSGMLHNTREAAQRHTGAIIHLTTACIKLRSMSHAKS